MRAKESTTALRRGRPGYHDPTQALGGTPAYSPLTLRLRLALFGLFACGAVVARVTARSWWYSGLRQLALGGAAAGVTYALGILIGTAVG